MPFIARQRSRLAVLAVLALVGSLLAVSAVPVAATDGEADEQAEFSACVGAATESAGFTDMAGSFAEAAADCLAHYGVTKGTAAGVFSPNASVTRLQMALFLSRAAGPAGLALAAASDQGLTDIGGMSGEIQAAINQMAASGIMAARSAGTFDPTGMVTREDMAVHLDGFLTEQNEDNGKIEPDDDLFTDIGGVTYAAYGSIRRLYELGVTTGTSDTMFSPDALVTRGQMAAFITRALAHTNARPAGLSMQAPSSGVAGDAAELHLSVRDADHQPVPDVLIDVFSSEAPDDNFNADGLCESEADGNCVIEDGDSATEPNGNASATVSLPSEAGTITVWAWTGEVDDKFDLDDTDYISAEIDAALGAANTKVTDDMKASAEALKYGDTVTYTFQVVDANGDPVAEADSPVDFTATLKDLNSVNETRKVHSYKTDAAGQVQVSFSQDDPNTDEGSKADEHTLILKVTVPADILNKVTTGGAKEHITIQWRDAEAVATTLTLAQATDYHDGDKDGVRHTVTATLVDQYGDPVKGKKIAFTGSAGEDTAKGLDKGTTQNQRTTNSSGVATKSYTSTITGTAEEISATGAGVNSNKINHYWALQLLGNSKKDATTNGFVNIVAVDTDNNVVVFNDGGIKWVSYKGTDQLNTSTDAVTLEGFEKALDVEDVTKLTLEAKIGDDADDINVITVK